MLPSCILHAHVGFLLAFGRVPEDKLDPVVFTWSPCNAEEVCEESSSFCGPFFCFFTPLHALSLFAAPSAVHAPRGGVAGAAGLLPFRRVRQDGEKSLLARVLLPAQAVVAGARVWEDAPLSSVGRTVDGIPRSHGHSRPCAFPGLVSVSIFSFLFRRSDKKREICGAESKCLRSPAAEVVQCIAEVVPLVFVRQLRVPSKIKMDLGALHGVVAPFVRAPHKLKITESQ